MVARDGRSRSTARSRTTHRDVPAIRRAARPEPTCCSATATTPFPPTRRNSPHSAAVAHCVRVMRNAVRPRSARTAASRIAPASRNRTPIARNGGNPATVYLIARYVEPQTR